MAGAANPLGQLNPIEDISKAIDQLNNNARLAKKMLEELSKQMQSLSKTIREIATESYLGSAEEIERYKNFTAETIEIQTPPTTAEQIASAFDQEAITRERANTQDELTALRREQAEREGTDNPMSQIEFQRRALETRAEGARKIVREGVQPERLKEVAKQTLLFQSANPFISQNYAEREKLVRKAIVGGNAFNIFTAKYLQREKKPQLGENVGELAKFAGQAALAGVGYGALGTAKFIARASYEGGRWTAKQVGDKTLTQRQYLRSKADEGFTTFSTYLDKNLAQPAKNAYRQNIVKPYRKQVVVRIARTTRDLRKRQKQEDPTGTLFKFVFGQLLNRVGDYILELVDKAQDVANAVGKAARVRVNGLANTKVGKNVISTSTTLVRNTANYVQQTRLYRGSANIARNVATRATSAAEAAPAFVRRGQDLALNTGRGLAKGGTQLVRVADRTGRAVYTKVLTPTGRAIRTGYRAGNATVRGVPKGIVTGIGAMAAFGLNPVAFAGGFAVGTTVHAFEHLAATNRANGYRQFIKQDGSWKTRVELSDDLIKRVDAEDFKNVFTRRQMGFRAMNAGLNLANLGAIAGTLFGFNPIVGAAAGFAIGAGGRIIIDRFVGRNVASMLKGQQLSGLNRLARVPAMGLMNRALASTWINEQVHVLQTKYKGNVGEYLKNEFTFGGGGIIGNINVIGNYLGAVSYVQSSHIIMGQVFADDIFSTTVRSQNKLGLSRLTLSGADDVARMGTLTYLNNVRAQFGLLRASGEIFRGIGRGIVGTAVKLAHPAVIGGIVGSVVGTVIASQLGIGFGVAALVGSAVGAVIGSAAGAYVGGLIGSFIPIPGVGTFLGVTVGTAVGQVFGQWVGSFFDKAVDSIVDNFTNTIQTVLNSVTALFNLAEIAFFGLNASNVIAFTFALIQIAMLFQRSSEQSGENVPTSDSSDTSYHQELDYNKIRLANYNTTLLSRSNWNPDEVRSVITLLDNNYVYFDDSVKSKELFILIGQSDDVFVEKDFVLISLDENKLDSPMLVKEIYGAKWQELLEQALVDTSDKVSVVTELKTSL